MVSDDKAVFDERSAVLVIVKALDAVWLVAESLLPSGTIIRGIDVVNGYTIAKEPISCIDWDDVLLAQANGDNEDEDKDDGIKDVIKDEDEGVTDTDIAADTVVSSRALVVAVALVEATVGSGLVASSVDVLESSDRLVVEIEVLDSPFPKIPIRGLRAEAVDADALTEPELELESTDLVDVIAALVELAISLAHHGADNSDDEDVGDVDGGLLRGRAVSVDEVVVIVDDSPRSGLCHLIPEEDSVELSAETVVLESAVSVSATALLLVVDVAISELVAEDVDAEEDELVASVVSAVVVAVLLVLRGLRVELLVRLGALEVGDAVSDDSDRELVNDTDGC
ncbi:hypothetical protein FB645_004417 [Coemansia sp. IMI 203386]|nr:hypothetical protein FB645_004417 [Coemansia sp. IMI 203386]